MLAVAHQVGTWATCLCPCVESAGLLSGPLTPCADWVSGQRPLASVLCSLAVRSRWKLSLWVNVPVLASLIPTRSTWAEGEGVLINYADTTKFCIKELYLFVNIHVNILKGTVHICKACIIICKVLCWILHDYPHSWNKRQTFLLSKMSGRHRGRQVCWPSCKVVAIPLIMRWNRFCAN